MHDNDDMPDWEEIDEQRFDDLSNLSPNPPVQATAKAASAKADPAPVIKSALPAVEESEDDEEESPAPEPEKRAAAPVAEPAKPAFVPPVFETDVSKQSCLIAIQILPGVGNTRTVVVGARVEWSTPQLKVIPNFDLTRLPLEIQNVAVNMARSLPGEAEKKKKEAEEAHAKKPAPVTPAVVKKTKPKLTDAPKDDKPKAATAPAAAAAKPVKPATAIMEMFAGI